MIPLRLQAQTGRFALVDGISFQMPVSCQNSPVLMAAFPINAERARALVPGNELFPMQMFGKGLLVVTVINYLATTIGKYIEFSIGIACTHQTEPMPSFLPRVLGGQLELSQFVFDLPVSSEISVKGGKGIWGMPKHQANLSFDIGETKVTTQYEADGKLAMAVEIDKPTETPIPLSMTVSSYSAFRGLLFKLLRGRRTFLTAAVLSALPCALLQLSPAALPYLLGMGIVYAYLAEQSRSLWPGILLHVMVNALATVGAIALLYNI